MGSNVFDRLYDRYQSLRRIGRYAPLTDSERANVRYAVDMISTSSRLCKKQIRNSVTYWSFFLAEKWHQHSGVLAILDGNEIPQIRECMNEIQFFEMKNNDTSIMADFLNELKEINALTADDIASMTPKDLVSTVTNTNIVASLLSDQLNAVFDDREIYHPFRASDTLRKDYVNFRYVQLNRIFRLRFRELVKFKDIGSKIIEEELNFCTNFEAVDLYEKFSVEIKNDRLLGSIVGDAHKPHAINARNARRLEFRAEAAKEKEARRLERISQERAKKERELQETKRLRNEKESIKRALIEANHFDIENGTLTVGRYHNQDSDFFEEMFSPDEWFVFVNNVTEKTLNILEKSPIIYCNDTKICARRPFSSMNREARLSIAAIFIRLNCGFVNTENDPATRGLLTLAVASMIYDDISYVVEVPEMKKQREFMGNVYYSWFKEEDENFVNSLIGIVYKSPSTVLSILIESSDSEDIRPGAFASFMNTLHGKVDVASRWNDCPDDENIRINPVESLIMGDIQGEDAPYVFNGRESLITIARPGQGKTQAHVIRNLLNLRSSAIVIDVKPEIYTLTAGWRKKAVGPIQKFEPRNRADTLHFNPLDAVRADPVDAFSDASRLVSLLMVPKNKSESKSFWESRAAQLLAAAIFDVSVNPAAQPSGRRDMTAVVDWFSVSEKRFINVVERLSSSPIRNLARLGNQLDAMDPETQANLFETVLSHIQIWGSPQVEPIVGTTTFDLTSLREQNGTIYLCVTESELVTYRPLIRAIIGHVFHHLREDKQRWALPPVTFFLDEFPQLGYMEEIEQMVALGRQAGLRLWFFAQSLGQISEAYGDADRLLDMMAVRTFIAPTGSLAEKISNELGQVRDVFSDRERPFASPQELSGPDYVDKVIVLEGGRPPIRLRRVMAFEDPSVSSRVGLEWE